KKARRNSGPSQGTSSDNKGIQPDPRWADELAKLKEMLATQASKS
ncbi:MAG: RNA-binding protein, partial [Okeania sp. SIO2D1]|nr:RNA-binding protein [Okeania sp. SIO2D1]